MALYARPYLLVSLFIDANEPNAAEAIRIAVEYLWLMSACLPVLYMPDYVPMMSMLKLVSVAIVLFLFAQLSSESKKYFYVNLGLSPRSLIGLAVLMDLAIFFVAVLIICLVYA